MKGWSVRACSTARSVEHRLFYVPGIFTPADEVIARAAVAGEMGGMHVSHMRNEASGVLDSVRETIAVGEQRRMPTQVTHHKIIGRPTGAAARTR